MRLGNFMRTTALAGAAFGALGAGSAHALLIDDFSKPDPGPQEVELPSNSAVGTTDTNTATGLSPNVIGGERDLELEITNSGSSSSTTVGAAGASVDDDLSFTFPTSADPVEATLKITWDGGTGLGGVDITEGGGATAFSSEVIATDAAFDFKLDVTDTSSNTSTSGFLNVPGIGMQTLSFGAFTGSANFTSVDSITLTLRGQSPADFQIDNVQTVPVPATLGLLGAGLIGLGVLSRRRSTGQA